MYGGDLPSLPEVTPRVNGFECPLLDYVTDVSWESHWGQDDGLGGCWEASWSMPNLDPNFNHPTFVLGAPVTLSVGSYRVFSGKLQAVDRGAPWKFTACGYVQYLKDYLCLDPSGNATSTPDTAIDRAISAGLGVVRSATYGGTGTTAVATGDNTAALNTLDALLTTAATNGGQRLVVDANRQIAALPDPTTPTWHLMPKMPYVGVLDSDFVTDLYGRYIMGIYPADTPAAGTYNFFDGTNYYATAHLQDPRGMALAGEVREAAIDLRPLGKIGSTNASSNLTNRLSLAKARVGFTSSITPDWWELLTPGGLPVPLWMVQAGDMVRVHSIIGQDGNLQFGAYTDVIASRVVYTAGDTSIQIDPLGLKARDFTGVLADATAPDDGADTGVAPAPASGWFAST